MKKETFLELASQLFDQSTNLKEEEKIPIETNLLDEIVDQISSELIDQGTGIINDYDLEMCGKEITLEGVDFNIRQVEALVKEVLERYFSTFG
jgi:hypothetical protein